MALANMMNVDCDKLECDLAETYHIYDIYALPPSKVALFSVGLRDDSRIKMAINNTEYSYDTIIKTEIADKLAILLWATFGCDEKLKPTLLIPKLLGIEEPTKNNKLMGFYSVEEFEAYKNKTLGKEVE